MKDRDPVGIRPDLEIQAAYLTYSVFDGVLRTFDVIRNPSGEVQLFPVYEEEHAPASVAVDLDAADDVIGIELIFLDSAAIALARDYATSRGLAFPQEQAFTRAD